MTFQIGARTCLLSEYENHREAIRHMRAETRLGRDAFIIAPTTRRKTFIVALTVDQAGRRLRGER